MDVEITTVFREVLKAHRVDLGNYMERDARYGHILAVICDELRAEGKTASLVSQKYPQPLDLPVDDLARASPYILGTVGTLSYQPEGIRYVDINSRVFIPASVADTAAARAIREVETGQWLVAEPRGEAPTPVVDASPSMGRPKKRHRAADAYADLFGPWDGQTWPHEAKGLQWEEARRQIAERMGDKDVSEKTIQRGLKDRGQK